MIAFGSLLFGAAREQSDKKFNEKLNYYELRGTKNLLRFLTGKKIVQQNMCWAFLNNWKIDWLESFV